MRTTLLQSVALLAIAASIPVAAYQVNTHRLMGEPAILQSNLPGRVLPLARDLRVTNIDSFLGDGGLYLFGFTVFQSGFKVRDWVAEGEENEDDTFTLPTPGRWRFHFYNPSQPPGSRGFSGFRDSADWGLEVERTSPINEFSWLSAREYLYQGLTGGTVTARKRNLSKFYRSLGQVMHLVQDLAQPQHTRNDSHGIFHYYENYTTSKNVNLQSLLGGYGPVNVAVPQDLWSTPDGKGIADFSNCNFVTAGTNFKGTMNGNQLVITTDPRFAAPAPVDQPVKMQIEDLLEQGLNQPLRGQIWFAQTNVTDGITGVTTRNQRASSFSLFSEDLRSFGFQMEFALNRFNYDIAHSYLLPRSVGYSAGFLNHVFKGKLEISQPDDLVYSVIDPTQADSFAKIKFKVKNTSDTAVMTQGTLVAVVKYNRNTCYQADLTGEAGGPNAPNISQCRTPDSAGQIAISKPITPFSLGVGSETALSFDFTQNPIPVAATDLFLQVVYRGPLAGDADGIAWGFRDLFEPTHITFFNATDISEINDLFYTWDQVQAGVAAGDPTFAKIDLNNSKTFDAGDFIPFPQNFGNVGISFFAPGQRLVANIPVLTVGRFSRITVLTDRTPVPFFPASFGFAPLAAVNQINETNTVFNVTGVQKMREEIWFTNGDVVRYCIPGTTCNGDLLNIKKSTVPDASTPVPVTITIQYP